MGAIAKQVFEIRWYVILCVVAQRHATEPLSEDWKTLRGDLESRKRRHPDSGRPSRIQRKNLSPSHRDWLVAKRFLIKPRSHGRASVVILSGKLLKNKFVRTLRGNLSRAHSEQSRLFRTKRDAGGPHYLVGPSQPEITPVVFRSQTEARE
ncbi:hypothetical protein CEXT_637081 [Caerostris extrusa]|uniref:Uncharacterized protein n=1 Tax=Caerostris extrusa TaxID=172846 RepID=A0AAV4TBZ5_CAEEX|nr:hypothetical protein CEXT_637081 [Caerostris extrusa]